MEGKSSGGSCSWKCYLWCLVAPFLLSISAQLQSGYWDGSSLERGSGEQGRGGSGWKNPQRHQSSPAKAIPAPCPQVPPPRGFKPLQGGDCAPALLQKGPTRAEPKPRLCTGQPKPHLCMKVLPSMEASPAERNCLTPGKRLPVTIISI